MFGLGGTEVLVIFVLALLLFGPRKLPEIGRTLGKTLTEFRRATLDFRVNLEREVELDKLKSEALGPLRDIVNLGEARESVPPPIPRGGMPPLPGAAEPRPPSPAESTDASADPPPHREDVVRSDEA